MNKIQASVLFLGLCIALACNSSKKTVGADIGSKKATYRHLYSKAPHPLMNDNTFELDSITADDTYGYTEQNPIMVGGNIQEGARNERRFLNALLGPNGENISYVRLGSCCGFSSPNGFTGLGLLDQYEVTIEGHSTKLILYINMYDRGVLKAPKGFTYKK